MLYVEQELINKKSVIPARRVGAHIYQGQLSILKLIKAASFFFLLNWDAVAKSLGWK